MVLNYDKVIAVLLIAIAVLLLYRRITAIGKISMVLWVIVLGTILWLIYGGTTHFNAGNLLSSPPGAWSFSWIFFAGLGHASVQTVYSYLGYYNVCNLGGEMKDPGEEYSAGDFHFDFRHGDSVFFDADEHFERGALAGGRSVQVSW